MAIYGVGSILRRSLQVLAVLLVFCGAATDSLAAGVSYEYDAAGRLKKATFDDGTAVDYSLDAAGNRTNVASIPLVPGTLGFSAGSYGTGEGGGSVTISVSRIGGIAGAVSVNYATANGSATAGSDYTAASGTLNWAHGDSADKTFNIPILQDGSYEGAETIAISLSSAGGGATLGLNSATITITDDDFPPTGSLQLATSGYSVGENGGSLTVTVTRAGGSYGAASINYATANGSATAGSDYTASSGTLSWANGDAADKTFNIPILQDGSVEGAETFAVNLSGVSGASAGSPGSATITITDDDFPPTGSLQLSASDYSVGENGGSVTITATRTGGSFGAVSVNYATANGSATAGSDYTATSGTLNWANGETANKTFSIAILQDGSYEGVETVAISLSGVGGGATLGLNSATLTINDDESPPPPGSLQLGASSYSAGEDGGSLTVTVTRAGGSYGAASINYATADGSATAGSDYVVTSGTLNWVNGDAADKTFNIPILQDGAVEGSETFAVNLSGATGASAGSPSSSTITITDDDFPPPGSLQLSSSSYSIAENGGALTVTVTRTGGSYGAASINYATANSSATAGSDYTATSGTLNWANGDAASKTFNISITGDSSWEGNETFSISLSGASGASAGSPASATVTIIDVDLTPPSAPGTPGFSAINLNTATATWSAATDNVGVTGYRYRLNGGSWVEQGATTTASLSGLTQNTNYNFEVQARDAAANWGGSASGVFTTPVHMNFEFNAAYLEEYTFLGYIGYPNFWNFDEVGSLSPSTAAAGYTVRQFMQFIDPSFYDISIRISGLPANVTSAWLDRVEVAGGTINGYLDADDSNYFFCEDIGDCVWVWNHYEIPNLGGYFSQYDTGYIKVVPRN